MNEISNLFKLEIKVISRRVFSLFYVKINWIILWKDDKKKQNRDMSFDVRLTTRIIACLKVTFQI